MRPIATLVVMFQPTKQASPDTIQLHRRPTLLFLEKSLFLEVSYFSFEILTQVEPKGGTTKYKKRKKISIPCSQTQEFPFGQKMSFKAEATLG